jgi:hypothetical protein
MHDDVDASCNGRDDEPGADVLSGQHAIGRRFASTPRGGLSAPRLVHHRYGKVLPSAVCVEESVVELAIRACHAGHGCCSPPPPNGSPAWPEAHHTGPTRRPIR